MLFFFKPSENVCLFFQCNNLQESVTNEKMINSNSNVESHSCVLK